MFLMIKLIMVYFLMEYIYFINEIFNKNNLIWKMFMKDMVIFECWIY